MTEPRPAPDLGPESVEIRRAGRWRYSLTLKRGWLAFDCGHRFGRRRAERLAQRLLAPTDDRPIVATVRPDDDGGCE
jgi:hypothetical protein